MRSETRIATLECAGNNRVDWLTPKESGRYTLLSRAKDANGTVQPDKHDYNYGTYVITHLLPIEVIVEELVSPER